MCAGKEAYRTFLDEAMHVTPALFAPGQQSLADAHEAFTAQVLKAAGVTNTDSILEVGGGWGAVAMHALREHDCKCVSNAHCPFSEAIQSPRLVANDILP
jgi:cyclopropane-fatty-acyl-phospholipid synthase